MKRSVLYLCAAILSLSMVGCSHFEGYLDVIREKGLSDEYQTVLARWTRSQTIYSEFETKARITATYESPEFVNANLKEFSRMYHLRDEEVKKRAEVTREKSSAARGFVFYAYIPEKKFNDFDKRESLWTVFLVNEKGERIDPVELRRIEPLSPVITEFFPYVNPYYGIAYRVRFPLNHPVGSGWGKMKLFFAGVIGEVRLDFDGQ
jgi:hypothetical protein